MLVSADLGHVALQLHFTCSATLFLSFEVRACCYLLSISQARKWFPSLRSLKSKSTVISTCLSEESALSVVFVDFSSARELPPPRYGCRRLLASPRGIKLNFDSYLSLKAQSPSTSRRTFLKKSLSSPIMQCSRVRRKKQSLSEKRLHVGSLINRWIRKC